MNVPESKRHTFMNVRVAIIYTFKNVQWDETDTFMNEVVP
jgi:hypothetical protein